jgi:hypothetical protein
VRAARMTPEYAGKALDTASVRAREPRQPPAPRANIPRCVRSF